MEKVLRNLVMRTTENNQSDDPACLFQPEKVKCKTWDFVLQTVIDKHLYWVDTFTWKT